MKRPTLRGGRKPESILQDNLKDFLEMRGWHVMETHGNIYQAGLPDLYCTHSKHKQRWIEVKVLPNYKFTPAQKENFPLISQGAGIWILTDYTVAEYKKLFAPPNWESFL